MSVFVVTSGAPSCVQAPVFTRSDTSQRAFQDGPDDHAFDVTTGPWDVGDKIKRKYMFRYTFLPSDRNIVVLQEYLQGWAAQDVIAMVLTAATAADEMIAPLVVVPRSIEMFPKIRKALGESACAQKNVPGEDKVFVFTRSHTKALIEALKTLNLDEGKDVVEKDPDKHRDLVGRPGPSVPRYIKLAKHILNLPQIEWENVDNAVLDTCMRDPSVVMGVKTHLWVAMSTTTGLFERREKMSSGWLRDAERKYGWNIYLANVRFGFREGVVQPSADYFRACMCQLMSKRDECRGGASSRGHGGEYIGKASLRPGKKPRT